MADKSPRKQNKGKRLTTKEKQKRKKDKRKARDAPLTATPPKPTGR